MIESMGIIANITNPIHSGYKLMRIFSYVCALILLPISQSSLAETKNDSRYGPVTQGESLWKIAEEVRKDKRISIEQFAYAIFKNNPNAFLSRNMNVIKAGAILKIPNDEYIQKISNSNAKKKLAEHQHALDLLRVDAKKLRLAKERSKKYKSQIKKRQKQLAQYRYESSAWNKQYLRLVDSKRNFAKSERNVKKLKRLLLEKATLKNIVITPQEPKINDINNEALTEVTNRLGDIQSSLENLNKSNTQLVKQSEQLETLSDRLQILEQELGKNDEVVIKIQKALNTIELAIEEQKQENINQSKQLDALRTAQETAASEPRPKKEDKSRQTELSEIKEKTPVEISKNINGTPKPSYTTLKEISNPELADLEDKKYQSYADYFIEDISKPVIQPNNFDELTSNNDLSSLLKASIPQQLIATDIKEPKNRTVQSNRQRKAILSSNVGQLEDLNNERSFLVSYKDKIILFGGILNGIILLYILYRWFTREPEVIDIQDDANKEKPYQSWQDRIKPKEYK